MASDQLILAFDTSAAHCAAALLCGDRVLAQHAETMAKGQAERLFPLLESLLAEAELHWSDLDRIGVATGPGNFTGIRIGVAAARGLALSLNIPAIGVDGFEVAAHGHPFPLTAAIAAPREQLYVMRSGADGSRGMPELIMGSDLANEQHIALEDLPLSERVLRIARIAAEAPADSLPPAPLYVRAADAAPSNDPPPLILSDDA